MRSRTGLLGLLLRRHAGLLGLLLRRYAGLLGHLMLLLLLGLNRRVGLGLLSLRLMLLGDLLRL